MARRSRAEAKTELETIIKAYCLIGAMLDNVEDSTHPDVPIAKQIAAGTLNQLLTKYRDKNGNQTLEAFIRQLDTRDAQSSDDSQGTRDAAVSSL